MIRCFDLVGTIKAYHLNLTVSLASKRRTSLDFHGDRCDWWSDIILRCSDYLKNDNNTMTFLLPIDNSVVIPCDTRVDG